MPNRAERHRIFRFMSRETLRGLRSERRTYPTDTPRAYLADQIRYAGSARMTRHKDGARYHLGLAAMERRGVARLP